MATLADCKPVRTKKAAGETPMVESRPFIEMVIAPFAAMGDALFWGGLRPLAAVMAVFVAMTGSLSASLDFLALFALPRLAMSILGFILSYRQEVGIVATLQRLRLADCAVACKRLLMLALGGVAAVCGHKITAGTGVEPFWAVLSLGWLVLAVVLLRRGVPLLALVWGTILIYWLAIAAV